MFVGSDKVKAFPLGRPRSAASNDITSRIFYESMVANLINQIIDVEGFLISSPGIYINPSNTNDNYKIIGADLEFNLGGYWFKVAEGTAIVPATNNETPIDQTKNPPIDLKDTICYVYACIDVGVKNNDDIKIKELVGQDVNSEYQGLIFITTDTPPDKFTLHSYQLPIFSGYVNANGLPEPDTWKIYEPSFIKFTGNSIDTDITGIDGKH